MLPLISIILVCAHQGLVNQRIISEKKKDEHLKKILPNVRHMRALSSGIGGDA